MSYGHPSILHPILTRADAEPDRLLYSFNTGDGRVLESYSYGGFAERTNAVAAHLRRQGAWDVGDRVLLVYPPGLEMLVAFFACLRLGVIPVPVSPPASHGFEASLSRMEFIARDCEASAVLTDRAYYWSMKLRRARTRITSFRRRDDATTRVPWLITADAPIATVPEILPDRPDVLFLQYTSGSTRDPRGVVVTHRNVLENGAWVFREPPVGASWLPQYHDMGLIGSCLFPAVAGGTTHLMSPLAFLREPASWLRLVSRVSATASVAPNFAFEFCLRNDRVPEHEIQGVDLGSLEILMSGAEPVRADVFRHFQERFAPYGLRPGVLSAAYGLAEYTLAVSNRGRETTVFDAQRLAEDEVHLDLDPFDGAEPARGRPLVSCGPPLGETRVRIVDVTLAPREARPGRVGEIWLDGPAKCRGYWNRPELSERTFRACLPDDPDVEWLRTGDLGFLHEGEIHVCGRLKDLIIVRGLNYYPQDIEAVLAEDPAIRPGCVAAFAVAGESGEELVVVAELRNGRPPESPEDLNAVLKRRLGITASEFTFVRKRTIEKTSSGKIRRHAVRAAWSGGRLAVTKRVRFAPSSDPLPPADRGQGQTDDRESWGTPESLDRTFHRRGLSGQEPVTLAEVGLDSLGLVDLALELERHLEAAGLGQVGNVIDLRWLQRIPIVELVELMRQVLASEVGARIRLHRAFSEVRSEHQEAEWMMMRQDAAMPLPRIPAQQRSRQEGGILLTGGTGFFGPFLLRSLLEQTEDDVHVLVRAETVDHGRARLRAALGSAGVAQDQVDGWGDRVVPVCGDLARPGLGLSSRDRARLTENTRAIYHNAAWVNYLHEYAVLRGANVLGTHEVIRLATEGAVKELNHVSTTFVFGWSTREALFETDGNEDLSLLDFGYSQSKWVSERLVHRAMEQGLPGRIFRPALIAPSLEGDGEHFDIAIRLLAAMVKYGLSTTAENQVSMSPADLVADNIVAISSPAETLGRTFHVTRDEYSSMKDLTDLLAERTGATFSLHELDAFVPEIVSRCRKEDLLFPLLNFLVRSVDNIAAMEFKLYDSAQYRWARSRATRGREDPPLDQVVDGLVAFMDRHGLIDVAEPAGRV
jgi:thioester reductase-like protein